MEILKHTSKNGEVVFTTIEVPMYAEFGEEFTCTPSSEKEYLLHVAVNKDHYRAVEQFKVISSNGYLGFDYV